MQDFSIHSETFGPHATRRIRHSPTGAELLVALRGATLLQWNVPIAGVLRTITDGHLTPEELSAQSGMRFGVMAPFSNRIADARYRFDGDVFDLQPGVPDGQRGIRHGFVRHADFEVLRETLTAKSAELHLGSQVMRPGRFPGYPFAIDVEVMLRFAGNALDYRIRATNVGDCSAPFCCGLHPYFKLGAASVDTLELEIAATRLVLTDSNLIPLAGDQAYGLLGEHPELDYRQIRRIGSAVIDCAFELGKDTPPQDSRLIDPSTHASLGIHQSRGLLHAFTGDTVARAPRTSVALEPVELPTNAFNREDCAKAVRLEPGEHRDFEFGFCSGARGRLESANKASDLTRER